MLRKLVIGSTLLFGTIANARFLETDADAIDPEERLGTETFIDVISYRFPLYYDTLWDKHDNGLRVSAGSLTGTRFDFRDDIKVQSSLDAPAGLAFYETRHEDLVEQRMEREFRVWVKPEAVPLRLALLADGGTDKEYGDLGGALALWRTRNQWLELQYWSVDHFYKTKKSELTDSRPESTSTRAIKADWTWSDLRLRLNAEDDTPLIWTRASRDYTYRYAQRSLKSRFDFALDDRYAVIAASDQQWKRESKSGSIEKQLERRTGQYELGLQRSADTTRDQVGFIYLERRTRSSYFAEAEATPKNLAEDLAEKASPARIFHRELAVYATREEPLATQHSWQYGLFVHDVVIREDQARWKQAEVKTQLGWNYAFTPQAHLGLNSTWDLDKLWRHYPYKEDDKPFRPWGGGQLQLLAVF